MALKYSRSGREEPDSEEFAETESADDLRNVTNRIPNSNRVASKAKKSFISVPLRELWACELDVYASIWLHRMQAYCSKAGQCLPNLQIVDKGNYMCAIVNILEVAYDRTGDPSTGGHDSCVQPVLYAEDRRDRRGSKQPLLSCGGSR